MSIAQVGIYCPYAFSKKHSTQHFVLPSPKAVVALCAQLLLQPYFGSFKIPHVFIHGMKMCVCLDIILRLFYHFYNKLNLIIFQALFTFKVKRYM